MLPTHSTTRRWRWAIPVLTAGLVFSLIPGCPSGDSGDDTEQPIFPANYRSSYTLVRDCRNSIEHAATIRIWVNSIGAEAYLNDENPLPVGTIIVKEEYVGVDCSDDSELTYWSAMRKELPGFDPEDGDWSWQEVGVNRNIRLNDKRTCIDCHRNTECVERDYMCAEP